MHSRRQQRSGAAAAAAVAAVAARELRWNGPNELEMCNGHSVLKRVCGRELEPVMCDGQCRLQ